MILLKILKLAGLDIPAKIEAAKASLELRVERATDHVKLVAQEAAVVAAFSAIALVTGAMAAGVGLIAIYRWAADSYGVYAGLAVIGAILIALTVIFAAVAVVRAKSLAPNAVRLPRYAAAPVAAAADPAVIAGATDMAATDSAAYAAAYPWSVRTAPTPTVPPATASDLVEPLASFLSKVVKYPSVGNPVIDDLMGNLRMTASGTTNEAIDRAADVIRHGNRTNLLIILTGAVFAGWLLTHHSRD